MTLENKLHSAVYNTSVVYAIHTTIGDSIWKSLRKNLYYYICEGLREPVQDAIADIAVQVTYKTGEYEKI